MKSAHIFFICLYIQKHPSVGFILKNHRKTIVAGSLFLTKLQIPEHVFSCEFCEIKNIYFAEKLRMAASEHRISIFFFVVVLLQNRYFLLNSDHLLGKQHTMLRSRSQPSKISHLRFGDVFNFLPILIRTRYTMATKTVRNEKGNPSEKSQMRNGAFSLVCQIFGIESLKQYQKESMVALSKGEDCFLCQPTGTGKSIVFQALSFSVYAKTMFSCKEEVTLQMILENCKSKVLVVSPLLSLIQDQENTLIKKKIKVTSLMATSVSSVEQLDEVGWKILILCYLNARVILIK